MDFISLLDDVSVLRIEGEDASSFLHTQLSNDITGMGPEDARLAAYCSPKGRMLGSMVVWKESAQQDSALLALVKNDLLEPLLKRLRMFVLRAKVRFEATALQAYGASIATLDLPDWPTVRAAWHVERSEGNTYISAPTTVDGPMRWWVVPAEPLSPETASTRLGLPSLPRAAWQAQEISAGLGWVEAANVELFIPQSLNYDLVGGVSFTKGCYPGQEIVARAHFRGAVKRRGIPGHCVAATNIDLQAGMDVFDAQRPASPAGRIINAALSTDDSGESNWYLFMEASLPDIGHADYRVVSPEGPAIRLLSLPYPLEAP